MCLRNPEPLITGSVWRSSCPGRKGREAGCGLSKHQSPGVSQRPLRVGHAHTSWHPFKPHGFSGESAVEAALLSNSLRGPNFHNLNRMAVGGGGVSR